MADPLRTHSVRALAEFLAIPEDRASAALNHVYEATKDFKTGYGPSTDPDPRHPGVNLAWKVEQAIDVAKLTDLDGAVVVVRDRKSREVGVAVVGFPVEFAELELRLGIGALRRGLRQA